MTLPRVLLIGPDWFADLLWFCKRAFLELNVDVRVLTTNRSPWLTRAMARQAPLSRIPVIGSGLAHRLAEHIWKRQAAVVTDELASTVESWRPELLISILCWGDYILGSRALLDTLNGVWKVGWLMDDPFYDDKMAPMLCSFDHLYAVDGSWTELVRLVTHKPVSLLPCGADVHSNFPVRHQDIPQRLVSSVAFVGTSYQGKPAGVLRQSLLNQVRDLDLAIYGDLGWTAPPYTSSLLSKYYRGGPLSTEHTNLVYNGTQIALNIHHPQFRKGTSLRTFAICASGAFQMVDWRPGLEELFIADQEIVTYKTLEELREKAKYYLGDDTARLHIRDAGYERVVREHTYTHRVARVLKDADLLANNHYSPQ